MPLQNRVKPTGEIVFSHSRGTMMGNRGNLHNENRKLVRQVKTGYLGWVTCLLEHKQIRRTLMTPGCYTELFFLDEATAFAAGHRPCNDCQSGRLSVFKKAWFAANAVAYGVPRPNIGLIDPVLQTERIDHEGRKVTYEAAVDDLPDGTFIDRNGICYLKWQERLVEWSFDGYVAAVTVKQGEVVKVLTPRSVVRTFATGFVPAVHASACGFTRRSEKK